MKGMGYFQKSLDISGNFEEDFFEGISWEEFFGRNLGEDFFWEDFFGRIFWEDLLWRIFLGGFFCLNC